jgi:hypothetical protein
MSLAQEILIGDESISQNIQIECVDDGEDNCVDEDEDVEPEAEEDEGTDEEEEEEEEEEEDDDEEEDEDDKVLETTKPSQKQQKAKPVAKAKPKAKKDTPVAKAKKVKAQNKTTVKKTKKTSAKKDATKATVKKTKKTSTKKSKAATDGNKPKKTPAARQPKTGVKKASTDEAKIAKKAASREQQAARHKLLRNAVRIERRFGILSQTVEENISKISKSQVNEFTALKKLSHKGSLALRALNRIMNAITPTKKRNPYTNIFFKEQFRIIATENPALKVPEIGKMIALMWNALSVEEKDVYRQRLLAEMPDEANEISTSVDAVVPIGGAEQPVPDGAADVVLATGDTSAAMEPGSE